MVKAKKSLSLMLVLIMLLSCIPFAVNVSAVTVTDLKTASGAVTYKTVTVSVDKSGKQDAWDLLKTYLKSGDNYFVKLDSDFDISVTGDEAKEVALLVINGKKKLDLNGHKFTINNTTDTYQQYMFRVNNNCEFAVEDSSGNNSGKIRFNGALNNKASDYQRNIFLVASGAKLTYNGGEVDGNSKKDTYYGWKQTLLTVFTLDNNATLIVNDGILQSRGATYGKIATSPMFIVKDAGACNVTINGGTFVAKGGADVFTDVFGDAVFGTKRNSGTKLSVNGGSFKVDTYDAKIAYELNGSHEIDSQDCRKGRVSLSYSDFKGKASYYSIKADGSAVTFADGDIGGDKDKSFSRAKTVTVTYSDSVKSDITINLSYPTQVKLPVAGTVKSDNSAVTSVNQNDTVVFSFDPECTFKGFASEAEGLEALGLTESYRVIVRKRNALDAKEVFSNSVSVLFDESGYWDVTLCGMLTDNAGNTIRENRFFYTVSVTPFYSVTYNSDNKDVKKESVMAGSYTVTPSDIKKDNATLLGWCLRSACDSVDVMPGVKYTVNEDTCLFAVWGRNYTVTLNADGGSVSPGTITVSYHGRYGTLPTPYKAGYRFTGWYDENGTRIIADTYVTRTENHTLTAHFQKSNLEVTLDPGEGATINMDAISVSYGGTYSGLKYVEVDKPGYRLTGWRLGTVKIDENSTVTSAVNHTLTATYVKTVTITFDTAGGNPDYKPVTIDAGTCYEGLSSMMPMKSGSLFAGWANGSQSVTSSTKIYNDITLTAQWTTPITVKFDANGGTCDKSSIVVGRGKTIDSLPVPTRTNYRFIGWYTASTGGTKISSGSSFAVSTTLYAHWSSDQVLLTFYTDETMTTVFLEQTYKYDSSKGGALLNGIPVCPSAPSGYVYNAWYYVKPNGQTGKAVSNSYYPDGTRFYPVKTAANIKITFNANGGVLYNGVETDHLVLHAKYQAALNFSYTPSRTGYSFAGWFTDPVGGEEVKNGSINNFTGDTDLYAHWMPGSTRLYLNPNYSDCYISTIDVTEEQPLGELPVPERTGYTFTGWYKLSEGGEKVTSDTLFSDEGFRVNGQKMVFAHWVQTEYTITLKQSNGTVTVSKTKAHYGDEITVTVTPAAGCAFDGFDAASGVYPVLAGETYVFTMPANNVTLISKFHKHTYGTGTVITPATATEAGLKSYSCTVEGCDEIKYETLDPLGKEEPVLPPDEVDDTPVVTFVLGDVDGDGDIDVADARYALRAAIKLTDTGLDFTNPDNREFKAADVNKDLQVKVDDARMILRASIGLETLS